MTVKQRVRDLDTLKILYSLAERVLVANTQPNPQQGIIDVVEDSKKQLDALDDEE